MTDSNNNTFRKVCVKPFGFDKMHMDKEVIEDMLYQIIYQLNEKRKIHLQSFIQYS